MTRFRSVMAVLAVGLIAASCGSSSKAGSTTTAPASETSAAASTTAAATATSAAAEDAGLTAAKAVVAQYTDEKNATIGVTKPLTGKPPKKTFAWLECELESCPYETVGVKAAAAALGWDVKVISSKSGDPGPAFQQAIDAGVDFIASSGEAPALYKDQAAAAKAKGIKILSAYDTTEPDPAGTGIYTQFGDSNFVKKSGPLMADWAIANSNGKAHALVVSIPDFAVLVAETDAYAAEFKKNCASCQLDTLNQTIDDLVGGKVAANVAAKLQSTPGINYVFFSFGPLAGGVSKALSDAGLSKGVTVYGQDFSKFNLDEITAGTNGAWSADPKAYVGWLLVDAAARLSLGMPLDEEKAARALPTLIVQDAATATKISAAGGDWSPPGMEAAFKKLWGV